MLFSMTHDVDRLATRTVEFMSLAQFRQDPNLVWLALQNICGVNPDDSFRKIVNFEMKNDLTSTWFIQRQLISERNLRIIKEGENEVAIHPVSVKDLADKKEIESSWDVELSGFRIHYHRLCTDALTAGNKLGYEYDSSLYGGTTPIQLPSGILEIPITFEDGYLIPLYRTRNAKALIERSLMEHMEEKETVFVFNFHQNTLARKREWEVFQHVINLAKQYKIPFKTCKEVSTIWGSGKR